MANLSLLGGLVMIYVFGAFITTFPMYSDVFTDWADTKEGAAALAVLNVFLWPLWTFWLLWKLFRGTCYVLLGFQDLLEQVGVFDLFKRNKVPEARVVERK